MRASAAEVRPRMRRAMVVAPAAPGMARVRGQVGARTGLDLRRSPPVARRACCAPRRTSARLWPRGAAAGASRARCGAPIRLRRDAQIRTARAPRRLMARGQSNARSPTRADQSYLEVQQHDLAVVGQQVPGVGVSVDRPGRQGVRHLLELLVQFAAARPQEVTIPGADSTPATPCQSAKTTPRYRPCQSQSLRRNSM